MGEILHSAPLSRIILNDSVIAADPEEPEYVQYRIRELAEYIAEISGTRVAAATAVPAGHGVSIVVGTRLAEQVAGAPVPLAQLGEEGFLVRSLAGAGNTFIVAAGARPAGTKFGLVELMKMIRAEGATAFVDAPVDMLSRPAFARRGMHLNGWPIGYPHGFRMWKEEDWRRYLDLLTCQGVNLLLLWPFMEIIPVPLSREDEEYLRECRRLVEFAQKTQGMEVWIMQCTNRVARDDCGVRDPRTRPYWRPSQQDLDPGDPEHFRAIMRSRETLYRIIDNADGVCNIDSDPGYLAGSPLEDYLKVLQGCRGLLDRHNIHGKDAKLVDWMWLGWGTAPDRFFDVSRQAETIRSLARDLPEPWMLLCGKPEFLTVCRELEVLDKTVLLPYGFIEFEPSFPGTNVAIDGLRAALETVISFSGELAGMMGNVQTPLLQIPHVGFFLRALWEPGSLRRSESQVLRDAADALSPAHGELIAACWAGLKETNPDAIDAVAERLGSLLAGGDLGRPGVLGRKLFPDFRSAAALLAAQLSLRAAQERLLQDIAPATDRSRAAELVERFLDAYLAWDSACGWHALWGWNHASWQLGNLGADPRFASLAAALGQALGDEGSLASCLDGIGARLSVRHGPHAAREGGIAPFARAILNARR